MNKEQIETIFNEIDKHDKVSEEIMEKFDEFGYKKKNKKKGKGKYW